MSSKSLPEAEEQRRMVTTNAAVALDATVAAKAIERAIADPSLTHSRRAMRATRNVLALIDSLAHYEGDDLRRAVDGGADFTVKSPPTTNVARAASRTSDPLQDLAARISELAAESRTITCVDDSVRITDRTRAQEFARFLRELSHDGVSQAMAADTSRFTAYAVC